MKHHLIKYYLILSLLIVCRALECQSHSNIPLEGVQFIVTQGNSTGIIDSDKKIIIPLEYKDIKSVESINDLIIASKQSEDSQSIEYGAINLSNHVIVPFEFYRLNTWQSPNRLVGIYRTKDGQEVQKVLDLEGSEVFPTGIKDCWFFNDTTGIVKKDNIQYLIDSQGNKITKEYDRIYHMSHGMVKFREGNLSGFLDSTFTEIIPAKYDWFATSFFQENGLANVRYEDGWTEAVITKDGTEVFNIGMNYRYHDDYRKENFLLAYEVDPSGDDSSFDHSLFDFNNQKIVFNFGASMAGAGYQVFEDVVSFWGRPMHKDYYELTIANKKGVQISKTQIPKVYTHTADALILTDKNKSKSRFGIMPMDGSYQYQMNFDSIYYHRHIHDGTYAIIAKKEDKYGSIDKTGRTLISFEYDKLQRIRSGDIVATKGRVGSLFSIHGDLIMDNYKHRIVESIEGKNDWYIVESENKLGVFDYRAQSWIVEPLFSGIKPLVKSTH